MASPAAKITYRATETLAQPALTQASHTQGLRVALSIRPLWLVCIFLICIMPLGLTHAQSPPLVDELNALRIPIDGPFYASSFQTSSYKGSPRIIRMTEKDAHFEEYEWKLDPDQPLKNIRSDYVRKAIELEFDQERRLVAWRDIDRNAPLKKTTIDSIIHGPIGPLKVIREGGEIIYYYTYEGGRLTEVLCKSNGYVIERISMKWSEDQLAVEGTASNAFSPDSVRWRNEYLHPDTMTIPLVTLY